MSDNSEGCLISMTTNQVASVFSDKNNRDLIFDYVIVDEASKCRLEDLIVSLPKAKNLVLIGDYMQLDPFDTINKNEVCNIIPIKHWKQINKSSFSMLFNKLMNQNVNKSSSFFDSYKNVAIMKRQYRMNQNIFNLIKPIYDIHPGFELLDAKQVLVNNDLMCIQINGTEKEDGTSFINDDESFAIVSLLKQITENFENYKNIKTIGVITAYRAQEQYIYKQASKLGIRSNNVNIQYGTIDRFQGKEYDLVLLSLVRTKSMGFTDNIRRMNVSFSRAKNHLIIFGNYEEINEIVISNSRQNFISTNLDEEEDKFVYEQLIPKLYKLRKTFNSNEERNEFILNSFKGNSYE